MEAYYSQIIELIINTRLNVIKYCASNSLLVEMVANPGQFFKHVTESECMGRSTLVEMYNMHCYTHLHVHLAHVINKKELEIYRRYTRLDYLCQNTFSGLKV